jgi:hypothetical protein
MLGRGRSAAGREEVLIRCLRQMAAVFTPGSRYRKIPMIYSSVKKAIGVPIPARLQPDLKQAEKSTPPVLPSMTSLTRHCPMGRVMDAGLGDTGTERPALRH